MKRWLKHLEGQIAVIKLGIFLKWNFLLQSYSSAIILGSVIQTQYHVCDLSMDNLNPGFVSQEEFEWKCLEVIFTSK